MKTTVYDCRNIKKEIKSKEYTDPVRIRNLEWRRNRPLILKFGKKGLIILGLIVQTIIYIMEYDKILEIKASRRYISNYQEFNEFCNSKMSCTFRPGEAEELFEKNKIRC